MAEILRPNTVWIVMGRVDYEADEVIAVFYDRDKAHDYCNLCIKEPDPNDTRFDTYYVLNVGVEDSTDRINELGKW